MSVTLEVEQVRQRIETAISTGLPLWKKSIFPFEQFGKDPREDLHLGFAVGAPQTRWPSPVESSRTRRGTGGSVVQTDIRVRWGFRIRTTPSAMLDYDDALKAEKAVRDAIMDASQNYLHVWFVDSSRQSRDTDNSGLWMVGEIYLGTQHQVAV